MLYTALPFPHGITALSIMSGMNVIRVATAALIPHITNDQSVVRVMSLNHVVRITASALHPPIFIFQCIMHAVRHINIIHVLSKNLSVASYYNH